MDVVESRGLGNRGLVMLKLRESGADGECCALLTTLQLPDLKSVMPMEGD